MADISVIQLHDMDTTFVDRSPRKFGDLTGRRASWDKCRTGLGLVFILLALYGATLLLIGINSFGMNERWWSFSAFDLSKRVSILLMGVGAAGAISFFFLGSALIVRFDF